MGYDTQAAERVKRYGPWVLYEDHVMALAEARAAVWREVLTVGNHIALLIDMPSSGHPPLDATSEEAMSFYHVGEPGWGGLAWKYEAWTAWKIIMQAQQQAQRCRNPQHWDEPQDACSLCEPDAPSEEEEHG